MHLTIDYVMKNQIKCHITVATKAILANRSLLNNKVFIEA